MIRNNHPASRGAQRGVTLLISMIFLVIITLMVVSAVKVSTLNTKVVGNMQTEKEAAAAAQQAIEAVIGTDFTQAPAASTSSKDIGLAGSAYSVTMPAPVCIGVRPVLQSQLDPFNNPADAACSVSGSARNTGIRSSAIAAGGGISLCADSLWDVSAAATTPGGGTGATGPMTHQGIAVRVAAGAAC
jgi:hypothetical protein